MKPFRSRGWRWLRYMEKILPIAGATGAHSFAPTEANPPPLVDQDQDSDHAISHTLTHNSDEMDIDSRIDQSISTTSESAFAAQAISPSTAILSTNVLQPPATKRQRLGSNDGVFKLRSRSSPALSLPTEQNRKSGKGKGKGKAKTSSDRSPSQANSSAHSTSFPAPSTSQRVNKITPAAALVELHGSVSGMTKAIIAASKPPESAEDKAVARCQDAVRLVQERDDGLSISEKAALIVFFGNHNMEADMYIALKDDQLRREVIKQWIKS